MLNRAALVGLLVFGFLAQATAAERKGLNFAEIEQATQVIVGLKAKDPAVRSRSERLLVDMGPTVLPLVRLAVRVSDDPELRARGNRVIKSLLPGQPEPKRVEVAVREDVRIETADGEKVNVSSDGRKVKIDSGSRTGRSDGIKTEVRNSDGTKTDIKIEEGEKRERIRVNAGGLKIDLDLGDDDDDDDDD